MAVKLPPYDRFEDLPGVGKAVAEDLRRMGYATPAELTGKDPQALYEQIEALDGPTDRCMLYTFRCVIYALSTDKTEPEKLLWWRWKDGQRFGATRLCGVLPH